jgi:hypothetical protein
MPEKTETARNKPKINDLRDSNLQCPGALWHLKGASRLFTF